ncbi:hypothetical protein KGQ20_02420 [Catenulispora sp. NF23]|uniref:Uncharacterized protein n=1 Tax=Catenulispora pinistramenti TaxID=2705254 RepID=A0ABS5KJL8_9ACTN|nr:hypothetical protein [Catenulispora pinistramenti]MBS2531620.1 hypothetical protein [Catenulispora pinistramenti]MBS2546130.1 hypothetical protein [Catenulispora pinistramenti]
MSEREDKRKQVVAEAWRIGLSELLRCQAWLDQQVRRVLSSTDPQLDAQHLVIELRKVPEPVRSIAMTAGVDEDSRKRVFAAIRDFVSAVPDARLLRNVVEHLDDYRRGLGRLQQPSRYPGRPQPDAELARQFQLDFTMGVEDGVARPVLCTRFIRDDGRPQQLSVDLIDAVRAARRLGVAVFRAAPTGMAPLANKTQRSAAEGYRLPSPEKAMAAMLLQGVQPLEPYPGANVLWKCSCQRCGSVLAVTYTNVQRRSGSPCVFCLGRGR